MKRRKNLAWWTPLTLALWLTLPWTAARAEVVDRTIAVVNDHVVTWSDLDEQMRFEALENGRALKELGEAERREAFEHLVQYRILRDQMQGTSPATASEVEARIDDVRAGWHIEKDDAQWAATLIRYGLSEVELHELATNQIEILKFMEFRVRPLVRVSRAEVDEYYASTLAPQVKAQGQTPEPVEAMTPKIRELLVEQKMNREMEKWLENLRTQSRVQILWDGVR
jgi:peptidyl-prolyl cis-trans isomerase SurA